MNPTFLQITPRTTDKWPQIDLLADPYPPEPGRVGSGTVSRSSSIWGTSARSSLIRSGDTERSVICAEEGP